MALERDQAGGRHALGMLDKAIEGPSHRHQADNLSGMHIGNCAGQDAMLDFSPLCDAPLFQPGIEGIKIREAGHWLPYTPTRILKARKSVVQGKRVECGVKLGGRRTAKTKHT